MPQTIDVPGHGKVEFPDGMTDDQIVAAIKKNSMGVGAPTSGQSGYTAADVLGPHESAARFATGMISQPLSGFAGLAGSILPGPQGQGADWVNKVQSALTYEPRTKLGGQLSNLAAIPGQVITKPAEYVGEKVADAGFPAVGAYLNGAIQAAPTALMLGKPASMVKLSPEQQVLKDSGVSMTPGQIIGGVAKRAEDAATSIPIMGDAVKAAQRRGLESFNQAAVNRGLEPIGDKLPKGMVGNDAINYAYGKLGDAYDALLPNLNGKIDRQFASDLLGLQTKVQDLPKPQQADFKAIVKNEVMDKFQTGKVGGETLGNIKEELGHISRDFARSDSYATRQLGRMVQDLNDSLKGMINRVNPQYTGELSKIDQGYSNFKITQNASANIGATDGVFTPAQLQRAVRKSDFSKDKARFAEGNAKMQDLSSAGKSVLPSSVPDSGTPFRAALMYALSNPIKATALGLPVGTGALAYSPVGQRAFQGALTTPMNPIPPGLLATILQQQANQSR